MSFANSIVPDYVGVLCQAGQHEECAGEWPLRDRPAHGTNCVCECHKRARVAQEGRR